MLSDQVLWCNRYGVCADQKTKGLTGECKGKPPRRRHRGGMEGQLRKLRKGIHPKIGAALPPSVEFEPIVPSTRGNADQYEHKPPDGFYAYVPVISPSAVPSGSGGGPSTSERHMALLERIRAKERATCNKVDTREPCAIAATSGDTPSIAHYASATADPTNAMGTACHGMNVTTDLVSEVGTTCPAINVGTNIGPAGRATARCKNNCGNGSYANGDSSDGEVKKGSTRGSLVLLWPLWVEEYGATSSLKSSSQGIMQC